MKKIDFSRRLACHILQHILLDTVYSVWKSSDNARIVSHVELFKIAFFLSVGSGCGNQRFVSYR